MPRPRAAPVESISVVEPAGVALAGVHPALLEAGKDQIAGASSGRSGRRTRR